jgi:hypothetical protein
MRTRKQSEYIICGRCKSTVIIAKLQEIMPINSVNPPYSVPLPVIKLNYFPFNPYSLSADNPYHLNNNMDDLKEKLKKQRERTRQLAENNENSIRSKMLNPKPFSPVPKMKVYKNLFDTINEITDNINKMGYKVNLHKNKETENKNKYTYSHTPLINKTKFNDDYLFKDYKYISKLTSSLPKIY